ncbi:MAG: adenylate/guanylate cyclase domain-containing protein [Pseudomonadota bacterium]
MESHGISGSIRVTEATQRLLSEHFVMERRGDVQVKGKGQMTVYLLIGADPAGYYGLV